MKAVEIGGVTYELKYGLKFIRMADDKYFDMRGKEKIGLGIPMVIGYLSEYDPLVVPEIVECALGYLAQRPSKADIDQACEKLMEEQGIQKVCDDFLELFKEHKLHGIRAQKVWQSVEIQRAKEAKAMEDMKLS